MSTLALEIGREVSAPRCPTFLRWRECLREECRALGPWAVVIATMLLAPLVTWFPMLAQLYPELHLPAYPAAIGVDFWGAHTLWLTIFAGAAAFVWPHDRWLAGAMILPGALVFWRAYSDPVYVLVFVAGALAMILVRTMPERWRPRVRTLLAISGAFQALYVLQQFYLNYDLLWGPLVGGTLIPRVQAIGTLGTVDAASAYIALTAPLVPLWALPIMIAAVVVSHSFGAMVALICGLIVHYRSRWFVWPLAGAGIFSAIVLGIIKGEQSARPAIQRFGLNAAFAEHPWIGWGLGGWKTHVPSLQVKVGLVPHGELWAEAHSDWVQWATETGALGVVILIGWMVAHRGIFLDRMWGGALVALGVNAGVFFPLRVVPIALVAILLLGLAQPPLQNASHAVGGA